MRRVRNHNARPNVWAPSEIGAVESCHSRFPQVWSLLSRIDIHVDET